MAFNTQSRSSLASYAIRTHNRRCMHAIVNVRLGSLSEIYLCVLNAAPFEKKKNLRQSCTQRQRQLVRLKLAYTHITAKDGVLKKGGFSRMTL